MTFAPRLEIDLDKIYDNARILVERLAARGISVTGITKAALGSPEIARAMLAGGVSGLGDSRVENIQSMRRAHISAQMSLIRSPMLSQATRVVTSVDTSYNTELVVIRRLSAEARKLGRTHAVVLMVELGDLREGILPADLMAAVYETLQMPNIVLRGIGTNLACRSGASPDDANMAELSGLVTFIEAKFGHAMEIVSGGNSANLAWISSGAPVGRINNLRLGVSILLGRETLHRQAITGLHTDAITLVAEVIESKIKPTQPTGNLAQTAFGARPLVVNRGEIRQTILAVGVQDVDPGGLLPAAGMTIIGSSSDHLLTTSSVSRPPVGSEMAFQLDYSALLRAMTSPYVTKSIKSADHSFDLLETA